MATAGSTPHDPVVQFSAVSKLLESKLSSAEISDLLAAVLAKKKTEVRPGDLITADLMNQVLRDLAELNTRVAKLEGVGAKPTPPISPVTPVTPVPPVTPVTPVTPSPQVSEPRGDEGNA